MLLPLFYSLSCEFGLGSICDNAVESEGNIIQFVRKSFKQSPKVCKKGPQQSDADFVAVKAVTLYLRTLDTATGG